jgi:hypothetical protein
LHISFSALLRYFRGPHSRPFYNILTAAHFSSSVISK